MITVLPGFLQSSTCLYCSRQKQLICTARVMKSILPSLAKHKALILSPCFVPALLKVPTVCSAARLCPPIANICLQHYSSLEEGKKGHLSSELSRLVTDQPISSLSEMLRHSRDWQAPRKSQIPDKIHFSKYCLECFKRSSRRTLNLYLFIYDH